MNETHGFSKQSDVCINKIINPHLGVVFGYVTSIFASFFKSKVADQIIER